MEPEALPGAIALVDMVDYQAGTVVSKTILKKQTGTVTLFAFDRGEGLSEHTTPFDALVHVVDGTVDITISGRSHHVGHGEMLLLPANEPHALKELTRFKMLRVMIKS